MSVSLVNVTGISFWLWIFRVAVPELRRTLGHAE